MNTITKIGPDASKGVYRHEETGFVIHDVWSVADVIEANGAIAMDMNSGSWCWVAGEDLFIEVWKRGGNSLANLAQNMLKEVYAVDMARIAFNVVYSSGLSSGGLAYPGLLTTTRSVGSDVRLFGVVTNLQAGRGVSADLIDDLLSINATQTAGCYMLADTPNYRGTWFDPIVKNVKGDPWGNVNARYTKSDTVIGRGVVAIPLHSWERFLSNWRANIPNIDEGEMAAAADAAINKFNTVFKSALFEVPTIRVPIILTATGDAYIDNNPTRSCVPASAGTLGVVQSYNPLHMPTIMDENGWWVTNPHCPNPLGGNTLHDYCYRGLDCRFLNPGPLCSTSAVSSYTAPMTKITTLGGVELMKILGGLYPRTDSVKTGPTTQQLIEKVFRGNHDDQSLPTQQGGQSNEDYQLSLNAALDGDYSALTTNYGHWHLAGQTVLLVTSILDACVQDKPFKGKHLLTCGSGNLCRSLRVATQQGMYDAMMEDVTSSLSNHLTSQYA